MAPRPPHRAESSPIQCRETPIEEAADGEVALEADRDLIGVPRFMVRAGARKQFGARGPVRLILADPFVASDCVERRETRFGAVALGDRECPIYRRHGRSR